MEAALCCTLNPSKKQSNHERNDARSDIEAFTDPKKGRRQGRGETPQICFFTVMLRDLETTALLTQGTMSVADKGKVAAVTTLRQIVEQQTAEGDAHLCPGVQASPSVRGAWERTSVAAGFRVGRTRSHTSWKKAQNGEPVSASSMWHQQRRKTPHWRGMHIQKSIRHVLLLCGGGRGHVARQWLDELPKLEKEKDRRRGETDGSDQLSAL